MAPRKRGDLLTAAETLVVVFSGSFAAISVAFLLVYNYQGLKRGFDMQHAFGFLTGCLIVGLAGYALGQLP